MADVVSPEVRSRIMSGIKGKNSKPEILVRRLLYSAGYRYRLHREDLPGKPDIVLGKKRIAIFLHGCFWHAHRNCRYFKIPSTRQEFWRAKLQANSHRDEIVIQKLISAGWRVMCIWECAMRNPKVAESLSNYLVDWIESNTQIG